MEVPIWYNYDAAFIAPLVTETESPQISTPMVVIDVDTDHNISTTILDVSNKHNKIVIFLYSSILIYIFGV